MEKDRKRKRYSLFVVLIAILVHLQQVFSRGSVLHVLFIVSNYLTRFTL